MTVSVAMPDQRFTSSKGGSDCEGVGWQFWGKIRERAGAEMVRASEFVAGIFLEVGARGGSVAFGEGRCAVLRLRLGWLLVLRANFLKVAAEGNNFLAEGSLLSSGLSGEGFQRGFGFDARLVGFDLGVAQLLVFGAEVRNGPGLLGGGQNASHCSEEKPFGWQGCFHLGVRRWRTSRDAAFGRGER